MLLVINGDAKHIYVRYKRSIERESDPIVPAKESTVIAQGEDAENVHRTVKDFTNEIATNEKGGKDFFEFDYNPQKDLFKFSGHVPQLFEGNQNYNGTTESEITIGGRRFRKKERIINQTGDGTVLSIVSTVYEPIDEEIGVTTITPNKEGVTEGPIISY
ncbi:hypothetical protein BLA29_006622 [Euroglyphus maynei]|uniref:Uncharacterized protein n=1 Tax=Euroglyphus maynei TaxID=6958 RepID=A0A1Y3AZH4_EURMA|nr:hypothetical protein BLA29_006622 [Euroglyphus maynei]